MDFEPSEHEPDEYDPEADLYNPNTDSLTIPQVSTAETDADPELIKFFWVLVLILNVAVLFLAVGLLFIIFNADFQRGGGLVLGGLVLFAFSYYRYRTSEWASSSSDGDDS